MDPSEQLLTNDLSHVHAHLALDSSHRGCNAPFNDNCEGVLTSNCSSPRWSRSSLQLAWHNYMLSLTLERLLGLPRRRQGPPFLRHDDRRLAFGLLLAIAASIAFAGGSPDSPAAAPPIDKVRISPEGDRVLALARGEGGHLALVTADLASGQRRMALQPDPAWQLLDVCDWASNERIVCSLFLFQTRKAPTLPYARLFSRVRLVAVDADGGNRVPLLDSLPPSPTKFAGVLSAPWTPERRQRACRGGLSRR